MTEKAKKKQVPLRTCIGTGVKKPKSEMIRIVRLDDPEKPDMFIVKVDSTGKERGRGASIDSTIESFDLAVKKNAINRSLKLEVSLTAEEVNKLRDDFLKVIDERNFRKGQKTLRFKVSRDQFRKK